MRDKRRNKKNNFWVHPMFHFSIYPGLFERILRCLETRIQKKDNKFRKAAGMKLALTLNYLASGESYLSLVAGFKVSE
jgi:hypothetical protein